MYKNTQRNIKKHTNLKVPNSFMLNLDVSVDKLEVLTQTHLHTHALTTELDLIPILQM